MVRRARRPGCKWDHVLVLVSETGLKKSTLGHILAGDDDDRARTGNFSDQTILPLRPEKRAELVKGKWVYELSELAGINKASVEELRSFISPGRRRPSSLWSLRERWKNGSQLPRSLTIRLSIPVGQQSSWVGRRLRPLMERHGWAYTRLRLENGKPDGATSKRLRRSVCGRV
jgi:Virulence-associated protein E